MSLHAASWVRSAPLRMRGLSLAKACSLGFRSGCKAAGIGAARRRRGLLRRQVVYG